MSENIWNVSGMIRRMPMTTAVLKTGVEKPGKYWKADKWPYFEFFPRCVCGRE